MKYYKENTERGTLLVLVVAFCGLLLLSCDSEAGNFYAEIGAAYAFNTPWGESMNDEHYSWKGSNPIAILGAGYEHKGWTVGYEHISNWRTGFPMNKDKETGLDTIKATYKWRF